MSDWDPYLRGAFIGFSPLILLAALAIINYTAMGLCSLYLIIRFRKEWMEERAMIRSMKRTRK